MSVPKFFLGILLSSCFIGIFGHEMYEQVSRVCKTMSPKIYRDFLNGTDYKTQDIIFTYGRKNEKDSLCNGSVYLSIYSQLPFSSDEVRTIARDYSFTDRLLEVIGKIEVSQNEGLKKRFDECTAVLNDDSSIDAESLDCLRLVWCHEYDFSIRETLGPITQDAAQAKKSMRLKQLLENEITCNPDTNTFSKVAKSILEKVNEDIKTRLSNKIPLPPVSMYNGFAPYGNFIFTEKLKRDKSWITITGSPHQNYRQLGLSFNYNIPKAKLMYVDVEQVLESSLNKQSRARALGQSEGILWYPRNYCVVLDDIPVVMNLTMAFEETYCKTFIQDHKMYLYIPTMRDCNTNEVLPSSNNSMMHFMDEALFGDVSKIVLTEIGSLVQKNLKNINCDYFKLQ